MEWHHEEIASKLIHTCLHIGMVKSHWCLFYVYFGQSKKMLKQYAVDIHFAKRGNQAVEQ